MIAITALSSKYQKISRQLHVIILVDLHMPGIHSGTCSDFEDDRITPAQPAGRSVSTKLVDHTQ
jgi:hypothetical protein